MAEEKQEEVKEVKKSSKVKCFKTRRAGLRVLVNGQLHDSTLNEYVKFKAVKHFITATGDRIVVGYLKTDNPVVIKKLADEQEVVEISEKEYKEAVEPKKE